MQKIWVKKYMKNIENRDISFEDQAELIYYISKITMDLRNGS